MKLLFAVHGILWLILVFRIVGGQWPLLQEGSSFGIYQHIEGDMEWTTIIDFPAIFNFAQKAWESQTTVGDGLSVYSAQNQLKVTADWAGMEVPIALLVGYSPTLMWVLLPLVPFAHATAYVLFNAAGLLAAYWMTHPARSRWGIGIILFFSTLGSGCFYLGQTAILTGAGLLFLAERARNGHDMETWRDAALTGAVLWALTAKPPIALIAIPVLIGLRRWRTLAIAAMATVASTVILMPWLGDHWVRDYVHLIISYDTVNAGPSFAWAMHPELMPNLRAILSVHGALPDDIATRISSAVWFAGIAAVGLLGLRSRVSASRLWSISIVLYFLFSPQVSRFELLQVGLLLPLSVSVSGTLSRREGLLLLVVPLFILLNNPLGPPAPDFIVLSLLLAGLLFSPDPDPRVPAH